MDFVMDPNPIDQDPQTGFPIYREISDSSIVPQAYTSTYKELNTIDDYGFFTEFLIRPGVRKFRQENVQLTVEQKGNDFHNPAFLIGFLGFRPGFYDGGFQPLNDHFISDRNSSMLCHNTWTDMATQGPADIETLINNAGFAPKTIEQYAEVITVDTSQINGFASTFVAGSSSFFVYNKTPDTSLPFATISQASRVLVQDLIPGITITPGSYEISNWGDLAFAEFTIPLDTSSYPQGYLRSVFATGVGNPDAFLFAADYANIPSSITIHNAPSALGINGKWNVSAHPTFGAPWVQLVGHTSAGLTYDEIGLQSVLALEKGITEPLFAFQQTIIETHKETPIRDSAYITPWQHTATVTHGNKVFTSHNLISPLFNHVIDSAAYPSSFAIQAKLVLYVAVIKYEVSDTDDPKPILTLLPSDYINSFAGTVDLI